MANIIVYNYHFQIFDNYFYFYLPNVIIFANNYKITYNDKGKRAKSVLPNT